MTTQTKPLTKQTRDQKLKILAALEEKRRRDLLKKPEYVPHDGQVAVHKSLAQERFVTSGNGFGKSCLLVNEIHYAANGYNPHTGRRHPVPVRMALVVDNARKIDEIIIPEYRKWYELRDDQCKKEGKPHTSKITFDNGSVLFVYSMEAAPSLFEGFEFHYVFVDEPIARPLYVALRRSLRIRGFFCRFLFCGTAISQPWLRRDVYVPWSKGELKNTECFTGRTEHNRKNLADGYIENFSAVLSEAERRVRLEGGFFDSEASALSHLWDRDTHIVDVTEWSDRWPVYIGIDPHPVKKHVAVMIGAGPDEHLTVLKELSIKATAAQFAETLHTWMSGYRVIDIVVDSLGNTEGTGNDGFTTFLSKLRDSGIAARSTTYDDKNAEDAVDRLQTALHIPKEANNFGARIPKLRVARTCTGVIENIESATWKRNKITGEAQPKLDTASKDYLAALCYALACNPRYARCNERAYYLNKAPYRGLNTPSQRKAASTPFAKIRGWRGRPPVRPTDDD